MDSAGVQVVKSPSTPIGVLPERSQVLSPTRLARLPPIAASGNDDEHPSSAFLQAANSELKETMKHLLSEAQSAEGRIQRSMEALWQRMLEMLDQKSQEFECQLSVLREDCSATKEKLARVSAQEAALVQQNAKMSMELVVCDKKQKRQESELKELRNQLTSKEGEVTQANEELRSFQMRQRTEVEGLQGDLGEKSKILREYQEKLSKMTEKVQKLTKQLASEKSAAEQLQKTSSDLKSQQTSENRKLALEISKLKSQLASSSTALAAAREEVKKMDIQMRTNQQTSEATIANLNKQHAAVVQTLERKIAALEKELAELKSRHTIEIDALTEELHKAQQLAADLQDEDDFLDARIRFLQHQNRQEKLKLHKERKLHQ